MPKIITQLLNSEECLRRSVGTDPFTKGWWYHGTNEKTAKGMQTGSVKITDGFWLTKNPAGASQCNGEWIVRCTVRLNRRPESPNGLDRYMTKAGNQELDQPYKWIEVLEGTIFIDKDWNGDPHKIKAYLIREGLSKEQAESLHDTLQKSGITATKFQATAGMDGTATYAVRYPHSAEPRVEEWEQDNGI
jgi:hypothetical protein